MNAGGSLLGSGSNDPGMKEMPEGPRERLATDTVGRTTLSMRRGALVCEAALLQVDGRALRDSVLRRLLQRSLQTDGLVPAAARLV